MTARTEDGLVYIDVADTGAGISSEHLPHVFDRFYRADSARSSHGRNIGLGLAIVQAIVGLHGGRVNVSSEIGRGTQITLALPTTNHHEPEGVVRVDAVPKMTET